jgi:hypothetical protein
MVLKNKGTVSEEHQFDTLYTTLIYHNHSSRVTSHNTLKSAPSLVTNMSPHHDWTQINFRVP